VRELHVSEISEVIARLVKEANYRLEPDMVGAFDRAIAHGGCGGPERLPAPGRGVGIGGNFDKVALLAKQSSRCTGAWNPG
jgi:tartrate dehydratase alpha subunit/fumarate hydratase class I-like protein